MRLQLPTGVVLETHRKQLLPVFSAELEQGEGPVAVVVYPTTAIHRRMALVETNRGDRVLEIGALPSILYIICHMV